MKNWKKVLGLGSIVIVLVTIVVWRNGSWRMNDTARHQITDPNPNNEPVNRPKLENSHIQVESPRPGDVVKSPLEIAGRANWYFEGTFPVELFDDKGRKLAFANAQAQSDWMTTELVPFKVSLKFDPGQAENGTLILRKDNPSGLPENDDSISIPVRFR